MIAEILKGSPAEKTGKLKVGDTIVEIDGTSVRDYSFRKILDILRGAEGSKAVLGVMRAPKKENIEFIRVELVRAKMTLDDKRVEVSYEPLEMESLVKSLSIPFTKEMKGLVVKKISEKRLIN